MASVGKTTKIPFVIVEWDDAWQDQENFATATAVKGSHAPMPIETHGWLLVDDEVGVSIANERSYQDGQPVYRGRTFILRSMVKEVIPVTISRRRTPRAVGPQVFPSVGTVIRTEETVVMGSDPSPS